jgi:membrane protein insertase Oxa1/YidC/SpoIIIJ
MPISVAYPAALFFYQVTNGLTTNIETYFINKAVEEMKVAAKLLREQSDSSTNGGVGIMRWIASPITALKNGIFSRN